MLNSPPSGTPARRLGINGPLVSAIGLGCYPMTSAYGYRSEDESLATIELALELGCNFFDTADVYGPSSNEQLLARALAGRRDAAFLATKFGSTPKGPNGTPAYVRAACDASLKRLATDWIDLYYLHRVDPTTPIEETIGALAGLVEAGKVRYIGLSEASAETIQRAQGVHPIAALQTEYSLWSREVESILPTLRSLGIALVASSPLGRGFLVDEDIGGQALPDADVRTGIPRYVGESGRANLRITARLTAAARASDFTPSQLALAWLLYQGDDIVPIPGTARREHLRENLEAWNLRVGADEIERWTHLIPAAAGDRLTAEGMERIDR
jgi:aryl-alcohol dehydrogenase-like predicted oxidoreductase